MLFGGLIQIIVFWAWPWKSIYFPHVKYLHYIPMIQSLNSFQYQLKSPGSHLNQNQGMTHSEANFPSTGNLGNWTSHLVLNNNGGTSRTRRVFTFPFQLPFWLSSKSWALGQNLGFQSLRPHCPCGLLGSVHPQPNNSYELESFMPAALLGCSCILVVPQFWALGGCLIPMIPMEIAVVEALWGGSIPITNPQLGPRLPTTAFEI